MLYSLLAINFLYNWKLISTNIHLFTYIYYNYKILL